MASAFCSGNRRFPPDIRTGLLSPSPLPTETIRLIKIPNEDSQDVELDDTNILDLDRYAGYDRNDSRAA